MHNSLKNERGMALAFMAVGLVAFIALVVVGVDLSRLAFTATEVQTVADIAASSGARTLYLGGDAADVDADAMQTVANSNTMDGAAASIAADDVDLGRYDFPTGVFTETGVNPNAVKADGRKTVTNFVAAALDPNAATTNVHKVAIAAISGPGAGCGPPEGSNCNPNNSNYWDCLCESGTPPCLPITAPNCQFTDDDQLPPLTVSTDNTDTAAWTAFQSANANDVRGYLRPSGCGNGNGNDPGIQDAGSTLQITNGLDPACSADGQVFGMMKCIWEEEKGCQDTDGDGVVDDSGGTIFQIPIIDLEDCTQQLNQSKPIVGFATVEITGACVNDERRIDLQVIERKSNDPAPPGGECFQSDCRVTLVD